MRVIFSPEAERDLKKLGSSVASRVVSKTLWFADNFDSQIPQPLGSSLKGLFKLRVGDWRALYEIDRGNRRLIVHIVDHRSKVYLRRKL